MRKSGKVTKITKTNKGLLIWAVDSEEYHTGIETWRKNITVTTNNPLSGGKSPPDKDQHASVLATQNREPNTHQTTQNNNRHEPPHSTQAQTQNEGNYRHETTHSKPTATGNLQGEKNSNSNAPAEQEHAKHNQNTNREHNQIPRDKKKRKSSPCEPEHNKKKCSNHASWPESAMDGQRRT